MFNAWSTGRCMAAAFVLYGLTAAALLALNVPPFQVPDELNHFMRAAQIADGILVGTRVSTKGADGALHPTVGGLVDPAIDSAAAPFMSLPFHRDRRAKREDWTQIKWSGTRVPTAFSNTAIYPPFFYLPSALGILFGHAAHLTVVRTLIVSRVLTAVTAVAIGTAAIAAADGAAPWIFTILTLPMSLFLLASASQDALLLACSALAGALLVRGLRWPRSDDAMLLISLTLVLSLVATARPAYEALAVLPLGLPNVPLRWRILATAAVTACVTIWSVIVAKMMLSDYAWGSGADSAAQLARLIHDPLLAAHVAFATLSQYGAYYRLMFIGWLGWLDTSLPDDYYPVAEAMLAIAAVMATLSMNGKRLPIGSALAVAIGVAASVTGIFAILYLFLTPPGNGVVEGVQGRYFIPLALAGTALLPALGHTKAARLGNLLAPLILVFPVISLAELIRTIVLRYYLGD